MCVYVVATKATDGPSQYLYTEQCHQLAMTQPTPLRLESDQRGKGSMREVLGAGSFCARPAPGSWSKERASRHGEVRWPLRV